MDAVGNIGKKESEFEAKLGESQVRGSRRTDRGDPEWHGRVPGAAAVQLQQVARGDLEQPGPSRLSRTRRKEGIAT